MELMNKISIINTSSPVVEFVSSAFHYTNIPNIFGMLRKHILLFGCKEDQPIILYGPT